MMMPDGDVLAIIAAGTTACATVVATLWRVNINNMKQEAERVVRYEKLHLESQKQVIELTAECNLLKGKIESIEKLCKDLVDRLQNMTLN